MRKSLLCLLVITGMISCEDKGFVRRVERVGEDVVLPCSLGPENNIEQALFDWMKGGQEVFLYDAGFYQSGDPQFKGRVSHFPDKLKNGDASMIIRNIQVSDSGNYSCYFPRLQQQRFYVELVVGICAKPRVMIRSITEDRMLLQCEVRGAIPKPEISWIDSDGFVLPAEEKLEDSDGLQCPPALMLQTIVTKTGIFRCRVAQLELNFTTEAPISAHICSAYAKPRVMILEITEDWALLQCEVRGAFPKPQISWIDIDGNVLLAEEKLEDSDGLRCTSTLMLQTNVTKPGIFHCQVTQKELNFTTAAQISVPRTWDKTVMRVLLGVAIVGWILLILGSVAVGIYWWYRIRPKRAEPQETREPEREPEPEPESESESDEALRIPLQESLTSSDGNPSKHCQPFFST